MNGESPVCTCQYPNHTPVWYASVATCPVHHEQYDVSQTPQWWTDGEARGWKTLPPKSEPNRRLFRRKTVA